MRLSWKSQSCTDKELKDTWTPPKAQVSFSAKVCRAPRNSEIVHNHAANFKKIKIKKETFKFRVCVWISLEILFLRSKYYPICSVSSVAMEINQQILTMFPCQTFVNWNVLSIIQGLPGNKSYNENECQIHGCLYSEHSDQ